jgi:hypothetical protein
MRFMVMHKVDANGEAGTPPSKVVDEMAAYIDAAAAAGVFKVGARLHPSSERVRLVVESGKRTVAKGPYQGEHELVASFAMIAAPSLAAATDVAGGLADAIGGSVEIEVSPVYAPWDLGLAPKPANASPRFVVLRKADRAFEAGAKTPPVTALFDRLASDGTLLSHATLLPSSRGARLDAKRWWTDGPFTESKQLVTGFSIVELPAMTEAKKWAEDFGAILGRNEVEVRQVVDEPADIVTTDLETAPRF